VRRVLPALAAAASLAVVATPAAARDRAYNILPPGQYGGLPTNGDSRDQLPKYDGLTPLRGNVTLGDIPRYFKPENFKPIGRTRTIATGRKGLKMVRDAYGVPHVRGRTTRDAYFGLGWAMVEDRSLLLALGRGPSRVAVADVPGLDAFSLVTSGRSFTPSQQAEALVTKQQTLIKKTYGRKKGTGILRDIDAYVAGANASKRKAGIGGAPFTRNDIIATTAFIGSIFGAGGGAEVANANFLARLRGRLGATRGDKAFEDLMLAHDPETRTTTGAAFPYGHAGGAPTKGSPVIDAGSNESAPTTANRQASNWLLVDPKRSSSRDALAVMGPQLGFYYPEIVSEAAVSAPGLKAQGAFVPGGGPYMLLGRTRNYAWSLTSANNDNRDQFLDALCEPGGGAPTRASTHYRYKGRCRAMTRFDAGTLGAGGGEPARRVVFWKTVHGGVSGTVTVKGKPYAVALKRSTFGRDGLNLGAMHDMTLGRGATVGGFYRSANEFGFTFNWGYVSRTHTAFFSSGRLPKRAPGTNESLPTLGTGRYDWRGYLSRSRHPHTSRRGDGLLLNWNNKPARGWTAADDEHGYGSVHRVEMFDHWRKRPRVQDVVSVMNRAATEDMGATEVWPVVRAMLNKTAPPNARAARAAALVDAWGRRGGSRLDRDLDGNIDDPGAAVLDNGWDRIAQTVVEGRLGPLTTELAKLHRRGTRPGFGSGWYSYVDKDLRTMLGRKVKGKFHLRYCARGSVTQCSKALWKAIDTTATGIATFQGDDPSTWRSGAARTDRITFIPKLIPDSMRWANRPTFQQVLQLDHP
jgi:acyl-homoserine lactone acylase PvdQ